MMLNRRLLMRRSLKEQQLEFRFFDKILLSEGEGSAARRSGPYQDCFAMRRFEPDKSLYVTRLARVRGFCARVRESLFVSSLSWLLSFFSDRSFLRDCVNFVFGVFSRRKPKGKVRATAYLI